MPDDLQRRLSNLEKAIADAKRLAAELGVPEVLQHLIEAEDELRPIDLEAVFADEEGALMEGLYRKASIEAYLAKRRA